MGSWEVDGGGFTVLLCEILVSWRGACGGLR